MLRSKQKFNGTLTDEELYYIEDGLNLLKRDECKVLIFSQKLAVERLILKLYRFHEVK